MSPISRPSFTRGRLLVGLLIVLLVGSGLSYVASRLRPAPSAGRLVYAGTAGVFSRDLSSGEDRKVGDLPDDVAFAVTSPDGHWIGFSRAAGEVVLLDLDDGTEFEVSQRAAVPVGWSPDNRLVVQELLGDHDLVAIDPDGTVSRITNGGGGVSFPVWIGNTRFAISTEDNTMQLIDISSRRADVENLGAGVPLAASPDGAELMFARGEELFVSTVEGDKLGRARSIFKGGVIQAATSRQGHVAVVGADVKGNKGVWVLEGGTRTRRVVTSAVDWAGWTIDGSTLLYARKGSIYAVDARRKAEPKRVSREGAGVLPILGFTVVS